MEVIHFHWSWQTPGSGFITMHYFNQGCVMRCLPSFFSLCLMLLMTHQIFFVISIYAMPVFKYLCDILSWHAEDPGWYILPIIMLIAVKPFNIRSVWYANDCKIIGSWASSVDTGIKLWAWQPKNWELLLNRGNKFLPSKESTWGTGLSQPVKCQGSFCWG